MNDLFELRVGIYWTLLFGLVIGIGDRLGAVLSDPSAENLGLLTVSSLVGTGIGFLRPLK